MTIKDHPVWIGLATAAAIGLAWLGPTDLQRTVCSADLVFGTSAANIACKDEFRAVTINDAAPFIDSFLGRAGGARPREAWDMLTPAVQSHLPWTDFSAEWTPLLWAERTGDIQPQPGHNRWSVNFRSYAGDGNEAPSGNVNEMNIPIEITRQTNGELSVSDIRLPDRSDGEKRRYPAVTPVVRTKTYNLPSASSAVAAPTILPGSLLRVLCQTQRTNDSLWLRTPLGWIAAGEVQQDTSHSLETPACDANHSMRADSLESAL